MNTLLTVENRASVEEQLSRWLQEYIRRRSQGDSRASGDLPLPVLKEKIAQGHRVLVESVARRYTGTGEPLEDLVQEGYLGLLSALEYFDPAKGVRFSTYATHFVAGAIRHFLRDRSRIIREPAWLQEVATRVERASEALATALERDPTPAELAAHLSLPVETVEETLASRPVFQVVSYEDGLPEQEAAGPSVGLLMEIGSSLAAQVENRVVLKGMMGRLKPFEQQVLYEFYFRNLNQTEIATALGVSCNYISVTLRKAVERLGKMVSEAECRDRHQRREISIIDPVSGLYTERHLRARLEEAVSRSVRAALPVSVIYFRFLALPDNPRLREEVLGGCGLRLRSSIRRMDFAGRGCDDSLVAVLTGTGPQVELAANRLTRVLTESTATPAGLDIQVGTAWHPEEARTAQALLARAREAAMRPGPRVKLL